MTNNWPIVVNGENWMRQQEKRAIRQERRRTITDPADLMGPGLGPFAVLTLDWNAQETSFNGHFYSAPGALNTPDGTKWWMGDSIATPDGYGLQKVWNFRDGTLPPASFIRTFTSPSEGLRVFSAWTAM